MSGGFLTSRIFNISGVPGIMRDIEEGGDRTEGERIGFLVAPRMPVPLEVEIERIRPGMIAAREEVRRDIPLS